MPRLRLPGGGTGLDGVQRHRRGLEVRIVGTGVRPRRLHLSVRLGAPWGRVTSSIRRLLPALPLLVPATGVLPLVSPVAASSQSPDAVPFPRVEGRNLDDESFTLPDELPGRHRLLLVPFHQWQQGEVDTWLARLPELAGVVPGLAYYEIPTLSTGWKLMRWMIDGGMKSGIADPAARARTITVYTDRSRFMAEARIPDHDHITVALLDCEGRIVWRARGAVDEGSWTGLRRALGLD